ncbi:MAG: PorT family protein [Chitinophagales bacterium]|nr:PorT family protein [Chitinophagales bacterium]
MKKALFIVLLGVCMMKASAQGTSQDSGVRFGLSLSPQISWLSSVDKGLEGNGSYLGFSYGLLMDILIPTNYAFATGLLISYEGGKLTYTDSTKFNTYPDNTYPAGTNVDYRLQYIEIPLSMKLRTNQIGYLTYFGQFGLQGGIAIRSRADLDAYNAALDEEKVDFGKDVTPGNLGLLLGGGIEYEISGKTALLAGIQFHNGFIDVTDNPKDYKTVSSLTHFRLQLGIYF